MNDSLSGPADVVIQFGAYLVPLAVLEVYLRAQHASHTARTKQAAAGLVIVATAITFLGIGGAIAFMWWPFM